MSKSQNKAKSKSGVWERKKVSVEKENKLIVIRFLLHLKTNSSIFIDNQKTSIDITQLLLCFFFFFFFLLPSLFPLFLPFFCPLLFTTNCIPTVFYCSTQNIWMRIVKEAEEAVSASRNHLVFAYYVTGHGFGHATRVIEVTFLHPLITFLIIVFFFLILLNSDWIWFFFFLL